MNREKLAKIMCVGIVAVAFAATPLHAAPKKEKSNAGKAKVNAGKAKVKALKTAKSGFELSELDLSLRGAGELSGKKQWGISDIGMQAIKNIKMVEAARTEAKKLLAEDPDFEKNLRIKTELSLRKTDIHFE